MLQRFAPVAFLSSIVRFLLNEWSPIGKIRILQPKAPPFQGSLPPSNKDLADPAWHPISGSNRYTMKIPTQRRKKH
jgi:hypothetical protein